MKFTSIAVLAVLFATSETNAIQVHSFGNNDGLKAILGAIVAGGDSSSGGCDDCSKPKCGCSKKVASKHSHGGADAARKVIEKATDDLERKSEERDNQKKVEGGIKKVEEKAEKSKAEQEAADDAKEVKHAVKKAEHK
jgi:hypothetical protein